MRFLLSLTLILIQTQVMASPAEEPKERSIPILDATQQLFGLQANTVANRLDLFFADQRADDELARSRIRIKQTYTVADRAVLSDDFQIRVNLKLPKLQDRFKFELEQEKKKKEEDKKKNKEDAKSGSNQEIARNALNKEWQFRADLGVNASIPPKVFSRARVRKNMTSGDVIHRFVEEIAWYSDRDWEEYTNFDSDLPLSEEMLIRFRNSSDWKVTRKDFKTAHGPVILQRLSDDDAISYGVSLNTVVINSVWYVNNYNIGTNYRRNLYKQWLYMDISPGIAFPKSYSFRRNPYLSFQLEALFGGI